MTAKRRKGQLRDSPGDVSRWTVSGAGRNAETPRSKRRLYRSWRSKARMQRVGKLDEVCHNKGAQRFGQAERTLDNNGREQKEASIRRDDSHEWGVPSAERNTFAQIQFRAREFARPDAVCGTKRLHAHIAGCRGPALYLTTPSMKFRNHTKEACGELLDRSPQVRVVVV